MPIIRDVAIVAFFPWLFIDDGCVISRQKTGKAENRGRYSFAFVVVGNMVASIVAINLAFSRFGGIPSGVPLQVAQRGGLGGP
ncbi:MAG: hypothetical protein ACYDHD_03375 [Vulcanimicrobiaceae bacterium]